MMTDNNSNRLGREKSDYLRLHASDPVNWNPWGAEALSLARGEGKLIFLSIGYATCHWCHVMARESFTDDGVAALLNDHFVPILVDCEERPDINQIYMKACRLMLDGYGGWPLNVILTPEQAPIFAAVYLPKNGAHGRPGLMEVLNEMRQEWQLHPDALAQKGKQLLIDLKEHRKTQASDLAVDEGTMAAALANFRDEFDADNGGFGPDPRFVKPFGLIFLLRRAWRLRQPELTTMVEKTLTAIRRGGITDQLGGGVHRYATDIRWRIPHFEKMIYDQAGLMLAWVEAWKATGRPECGEAAREIATYVFRDLTSREGLFFAGEDADIDGEEGSHFVWKRSEIIEVLGKKEGAVFCRVYSVTEEGNFRHGVAGEGTNVLYMTNSLEHWSAELGCTPGELEKRLGKSRSKLLIWRREKQLPATDRQVVTAWNSLMISALAAAGNAFRESSYVAAARRAANRIWRTMYRNDRLAHGTQAGEIQGAGFAADYIFFARALLDLFDCTLESPFLIRSVSVARQALHLFNDDKGGGLFETAAEGEQLIVRLKHVEEREMPSTNSMALELFTRLWQMTAEEEWKTAAKAIIMCFSSVVAGMPAEFPWFLEGAARLREPFRKVCITGKRGETATEKLIEATRSLYSPDTIVLFRSDNRKPVPLPKGSQTPIPGGQAGKPAAFLCDDRSCRPPIVDAEELARVLLGYESYSKSSE